MSNNTNKTNVPEAKEAMDRFKMEVAKRAGSTVKQRLQRQPDFRTERFRRRLYGQKDDRGPGAPDGR